MKIHRDTQPNDVRSEVDSAGKKTVTQPDKSKQIEQLRATTGQVREILENLFKIGAIFWTISTSLIVGTQKLWDFLSPDRAHDVTVILLYGGISFLLALIFAFGVGIYRNSPAKPVKPVKPGERTKPRAAKLPPYVRKGIYFFVLLLAIFLGFQTRLWYIAKARLWGPYLDLTSSKQEDTFKSTVNLPWVNYGQDFGRVNGWEWKGVSNNRPAMESLFQRLSDSGVNSIVWFLLCDGRGALQFDGNGDLVGVTPEFWKDYDAAIELARKHEIGILWVLLDYKYMAPSKVEKGVSLFGHADFIQDGDDVNQFGKRNAFFDRVLDPLVKRYPYESSILGWVLINEPDIAVKEGWVSFDSIQNFTSEAARRIRGIAFRQPISVAYSDPESLLEYSSKAFDDLDFLIFHHYGAAQPPPLSRINSAMQRAMDKPVYIGEFDKDAPPTPYDTFISWARNQGFAGVWPWSFTSAKVEPPLPLDPSQLPAQIQEHETYCNQAVSDIQVNQALLKGRDAEKSAKISELNQVHDCIKLNQNNRQGLRNCENWKRRVNNRIKEIEQEMKAASSNLDLAKLNQRLHCPQSFWKSYKLKWSRRLAPQQ
jgi:hypothetical protein